jgi:hypothetical protein
MHEHTVLITGIGYQTARALAQRGHSGRVRGLNLGRLDPTGSVTGLGELARDADGHFPDVTEEQPPPLRRCMPAMSRVDGRDSHQIEVGSA